MRRERWGTLGDGTAVENITLGPSDGPRVRIATFGATVTSIEVPDRRGRLGEVTLGLDDLAAYAAGHPHFGSICGRVANRIAHGRFTLDGVAHLLATNAGKHHLHGGDRGFDARVWAAESLRGGRAVELSYRSPDGEEGYPGALDVSVTYTLDGADLRIDYRATADRATPLNLTQHSYFHLGGPGSGTIRDHILEIAASHYLPVGDGLVPTGEIAAVAHTPFDFTAQKAIGRDLDAPDRQLALAGGYDHCFVLEGAAGAQPRLVARARELRTGRSLEVWTSTPGLQLYTGNSLDGSYGRSGRVFERHGGFCLEAHALPDAPNHAHFPDTVLRPANVYTQTTLYCFATV